jgi:DNA-binding NarL/FixJ family response regulator
MREFADVWRRSIRFEPCSPEQGNNQVLRAIDSGDVHSQPEDWVERSRAFRGGSTNAPQKDCGADTVRVVSAALEAFDFLGIGWVVCNVSGRILGTNRTAENILRNRDGLEVNSDGVLCTTQGENGSVQQAVRLAAEGERLRNSGSQEIAMVVRRASGKGPLTLLVRSIKRIPTRPAALMLILDSSLPFRTRAADLSQLYGLTPAETQLAVLLMEGCALKDCCCTLGISLATGRTHLKRIFRKTSVHCQNQLVSVLIKTIGLARLGSLEVNLKAYVS